MKSDFEFIKRRTRRQLLAVTAISGLFLGAPKSSHAQKQNASSSAAAAPSHTQDVNKIISDAVKASGGSKALAAIRTVTLEGSFPAKDSLPGGTFTLDLKLPNRYYMELVAGDHSVIESFNGKSAWRQNAAGEIGTLVGPEALQIEAAARYYNSHLVGLKRSRLAVKLVGPAQIQGHDALEIEISALSGAKRQVYFDAQTHLIVEEAAQMGGVDQTIFYSDYRTVSGVQLPNKLTLQRGADTFDIQITRSAINEQIGERVFDFPHKAQVVLPDLKKLFAEVRAKEAANDKLRQQYSGTKIETENDVDKKGNPKKTEVTESDFFYINGTEVNRVLKKNGQPLSAAERKTEDDRVAKEVARLRNPPPKKAEKNAKPDQNSDSKTDASKDGAAKPDADSGNKRDDADRSDDDVKDSDFSIDTFLRVVQLVNPRRERYQGQDVLAFDFEPNPEYKAHGLVEKIIQKLGGVMWIDENAHDVVRLDAFFENDMKFAGGLLADLEKDSRVVIMNTYVNDQVWVPQYEQVTIGLRLLLVKTFRIEESTKYFNYKKFDPASLDATTPK